jgi:hypothetical protein
MSGTGLPTPACSWHNRPMTIGRRFASALVWAGLALAPAGLQARCDAPVRAGAASPLIAKLISLDRRRGHAGNTVPAPYAHALGLAGVGTSWMNYSVGLRFAGGKIHSFQIGIGGGNGSDVLFTTSHPGGLTAFRAGRDQTLVCAIRLDIARKRVTTLKPDEARPGYAAEIALWAAKIDGINAGAVELLH